MQMLVKKCLMLVVLFGFLLQAQASANNLLLNPGFEDPKMWSHAWSIENIASSAAPYVYHLTANGGGHSQAQPHGGDHAIEIYSSDRVTRLSQIVNLGTGVYRLSAWARNNGASIGPQLQLSVGDKSIIVPVLSDRYRQYFADFEVAQPGPQRVAFVSKTRGLALDDLALAPLRPDQPTPPYLFFDLSPTSQERSEGVQYYFRGQKQWVNFTVSTTAPKLVKNPALRLTVPVGVTISGFNTILLQRWKRPEQTDTTLKVSQVQQAKKTFRVFEVPIPRFVNGDAQPLSFGGFWVSVPDGKDKTLMVDLLVGGNVISSNTVELKALDPPARLATPKSLKIIFYSVQDWKMSATDRLEALPRQFSLMGGNVWSDYQIIHDETPITPGEDELVRNRAAKEFGVKAFWPNFSALLETGDGISAWRSMANQYHDPDMFFTSAAGTINSREYNLRYTAENGAAWKNSALRAYQRTLKRPEEIGLSYRNSGFITDALEGVPLSYDKTTLAEFAKEVGLNPVAVTVADLRGPLQKQWKAYNMKLYAQTAENLAQALRHIYPKVNVVNTANSYGPFGMDELSLAEQASWATAFDFTMPQWYAMGFYGGHYYSELKRGLQEKVYGRTNDHAYVIPLLNLSMGTGIELANNLRFKVFDLLSASREVKGVGYYIGTNAFADARTMLDLSRLHTILAGVEEYYTVGQLDASGAVTFEPKPMNIAPQAAIDAEGKQAIITPRVETTVRVHHLGRKGRIVLVTIISHCNQGVGEKGYLHLNLRKLGVRSGRDVIFDHLTGKTIAMTNMMSVDTNLTGNMALLEIIDRGQAAQLKK